ncbi:MAG: hypothetical protein FWF82_06020 [Oscillospiraceae bacterium]|nr:hypothetical protein [Oscillospiraceae bacterium]
MKKLLAILLAASIVLTLAACKTEEDEGNTNSSGATTTTSEPAASDTTTEPTDEVEPDEPAEGVLDIEDSKVKEAYDFLETDTFSFEMDVDLFGLELTAIIYKDGESYAMQIGSGDTVGIIVNDGKFSYLNNAEKTCEVIDLSLLDEAEREGFLDMVNAKQFAETFAGLDEITMTEMGKTTFGGKRLDYEEFELDMGFPIRFFFDGKDLVGMAANLGPELGGLMQLGMKISDSVSASAFDIPSDYEVNEIIDPEELEEFTSNLAMLFTPPAMQN